MVDLEPAVGDELNKVRPVVVLSGDEYGALDIKLVAPLNAMTPNKIGKAWLVPVCPAASNGLSKHSVVDVLQMRGVSGRRFGRRLGSLSDPDLSEIAAAAAAVVGYV